MAGIFAAHVTTNWSGTEWYIKYTYEFNKAGELALTYGLTAQQYWSVFQVNRAALPNERVGPKVLSAAGWALKFCPELQERIQADEAADMPIPEKIQSEIDWAFALMFVDPETKGFEIDEVHLRTLHSGIAPIPAYMRICMAPTDPEVIRRWGVEGCQFLEDYEKYEEAIFSGRYGFNLSAIKQLRDAMKPHIQLKQRFWRP